MNDSGVEAPVESGPAPVAAQRAIWSRLGPTAWMGVFIAAVVIIATAIVLVAGNRGPANYPADSPEGALQRYLVAWYDEDYDTAYEYFSTPIKARMSFTDFTAYLYDYGDQAVTINRSTGDGDRRRVYVTVEEFYGVGPGSSYTHDEIVSMVQEAGAWKIDEALSGINQNYNGF